MGEAERKEGTWDQKKMRVHVYTHIESGFELHDGIMEAICLRALSDEARQPTHTNLRNQ